MVVLITPICYDLYTVSIFNLLIVIFINLSNIVTSLIFQLITNSKKDIEILHEFCELHRIFPDLNFSLLKQSSTSSNQLTNSNTTKASIQALKDKINHPSSQSNNEKLVEFCKERLIHLQNNSDDNLYSYGDKAKGKEILPRKISKYNEKSPNNSDKIIIDQNNVYEIDKQSSEITNIQESQTIQKSWKMNVLSIVATDNINSNSSCNYNQLSNLKIF